MFGDAREFVPILQRQGEKGHLADASAILAYVVVKVDFRRRVAAVDERVGRPLVVPPGLQLVPFGCQQVLGTDDRDLFVPKRFGSKIKKVSSFPEAVQRERKTSLNCSRPRSSRIGESSMPALRLPRQKTTAVFQSSKARKMGGPSLVSISTGKIPEASPFDKPLPSEKALSSLPSRLPSDPSLVA